MRLSANRSSPFYSDRAVRFGQISVDGVPIRAVVECDTVEGWADVIATRDDGKILFDPKHRDRAAVVRYTGKIEVTFKENAA